MINGPPARQSGPTMRVVLIGPVAPYRGGIAQHTTHLHRALMRSTECMTISFSRQYPKLLFPGDTDVDDSLGGFCEEGVDYLIDSLNPMSWWKAVERIKSYRPQVVIFPWWHVYWTPCFTFLCIALASVKCEKVFICHNAVDHEDGWWKQKVARIALRLADRFVVHAESERAYLADQFFDRPIAVSPHPVVTHRASPAKRLARRAKLEVLFFGFVRPYKGIDVLLAAMEKLRDEDVALSIVGKFWSGKDEACRFISEHELDTAIELVDRYVSDGEAAAFFDRCDVVVLPYHSATASGVIASAYQYRKPVIVTRVGGLPEAVQVGKTGMAIDPGSSDQLAEALRAMLVGEWSAQLGAIDAMALSSTWPHFVDVVLRAREGEGGNSNCTR
jgi:glycosyltransferase involved in cell wall biosynthesis